MAALLPLPVRDVAVRYHVVGACGPYAAFTADFEPPGPQGQSEFLNAVPAQALPEEFAAPLWEGVRDGLDGVAALVLLTEGRYHEVDSSAYGYRVAGRMAGRAALVLAGLRPPGDWPPVRYVPRLATRRKAARKSTGR